MSSVGKGTIQHPGPTTASQPIFQAQWEHVRCEDSEARAECGGDAEGCHQHRAPVWHGSPRRGAETRPLEVPVRGPLRAVLSTVSKEQGLRSQSAVAEQ